MYRDGVGEGQFAVVENQEINPIKRLLEKKYKNVKPQFAYITVHKRVNARFFKMTGNRAVNPSAGTGRKENILMLSFYLINCHFQFQLSIIQSRSGIAPTFI